MKRIKKLLCLLLSLSMLASLCTGCGNSAGQKEKAKKIGISMPNDSDARWSADSETLHDILTAAGYECGMHHHYRRRRGSQPPGR